MYVCIFINRRYLNCFKCIYIRAISYLLYTNNVLIGLIACLVSSASWENLRSPVE